MTENACIDLESVAGDLNIHERRGMIKAEESGVASKTLSAKNANFHRVAVLHNLQARDKGIANEITIEYFRAIFIKNLAVDQESRFQRGDKRFVFGFRNGIEDVIATRFPACCDWDLCRNHGNLAMEQVGGQQGLETSLVRVTEPQSWLGQKTSAARNRKWTRQINPLPDRTREA